MHIDKKETTNLNNSSLKFSEKIFELVHNADCPWSFIHPCLSKLQSQRICSVRLSRGNHFHLVRNVHFFYHNVDNLKIRFPACAHQVGWIVLQITTVLQLNLTNLTALNFQRCSINLHVFMELKWPYSSRTVMRTKLLAPVHLGFTVLKILSFPLIVPKVITVGQPM